MTRRTFAKIWAAAAGGVAASGLTSRNLMAGMATTEVASNAVKADTRSAEDDKLQSEFLLELVFERGPSGTVGAAGLNHVVVAVAGGTFEGPKLKGTIIGPSGDWIVGRPDGSGVLDMRMLLQTDDAQKIAMTCRGIAYTQQGGALYARILPMFETAAARYAWLNNIVAVGVYRPMQSKIGYRIYQIL